MMRFRRCQWRWHLDYELGGRSIIDSPSLAFGSALHKAAESLMDRTEEKRTSIDESIGIFEAELSKRFGEMPQWQVLGHYELDEDTGKETWIDPPDRAAMSGEAHRIMTDLSTAPELKGCEPLVSELKIEETIDRSDGVQMRFTGYIDFIFKAPAKRGKKTILYICDFKTCTWGWPNEKKRDDEVHSQLFLYKHFVCKKLEINPADVRTVFILLKRRPRVNKDKTVESSVEFFQPSSGPVSVTRAVEMLQKAITGMNMESLTKNRDECVNRWEVCPYMGTDWCTSDSP